eukprot:3426466-Prymnesium_polylepis.1
MDSAHLASPQFDQHRHMPLVPFIAHVPPRRREAELSSAGRTSAPRPLTAHIANPRRTVLPCLPHVRYALDRVSSSAPKCPKAAATHTCLRLLLGCSAAATTRTRHTSHVTRHTSHVTRHTSH